MSRFGNLELGDESGNLAARQPSRIQDGAHCLGEARTAFENGNFESALRWYSRVLEFEPENAAAWTGQVRMLIELGEFQEARLWADKALEKFPSEAELLAAKAVALGRIGDLDGALSFSDASVEARGETPYVWLARGDVLLARSEARADYCFQKALAAAPGDWFLPWLAARIRFYYQQFALALQLLQQALERNAGHFRLWLELGMCQQALGLMGPARHSFTQARQLKPDCPEIREEMSRLASAGVGGRLLGWWRRLFHK
jgi:Flp pilus assembly protein TadD